MQYVDSNIEETIVAAWTESTLGGQTFIVDKLGVDN